MKIDGNVISKEVLAKAMTCDTPEELVKLAKENGVELTKEQAEAYISEIEDIDLDSSQLKEVAGGYCNKCGSLKSEPSCYHRHTYRPW